MFVDGPLLTTLAAQHLTAKGYWKLMPRIHGPYRVFTVLLKYLKMLQEGVENSITINRVIRLAQEG